MISRNCRIKFFNYRRTGLRRVSVLFAVTLVVLGLSACTNSPMLVRMAYERFPSHLSSELSDLATLTRQQQEWIETAAVHHHNWHRRTQLPRYVEVINNLARQVQNDRTFDFAYADSLIAQSRDLMLEIGRCNPALFASDRMRELSDQQVDQIRQNLQKKLAKSKKKYSSKTQEERKLDRFKKIRKFLSYADLNLNEYQESLLKRTLDNQVSLGLRRFELTELWNMQLVYILQSRKQAGFEEKIQTHIRKRWHLIESEEAEVWADTHNNWRNFTAELMESLSDQQRKEFSAWLSKMSRTLNTLANERPKKLKTPSPLPPACSAQV